MGISFNVNNLGQSSSYLFQGLSGGGYSNLNFLSDYMSIKNGSYGKLMRAYYNGSNSSYSYGSSSSSTKTGGMLERILEEKRNPKVSKDTQEANANLTSGITTLKKTVSTLQNAGTYKASEDGTSAAEKVVSAVKDFVSQYNDVVTAAKNSTLTGKTSHVAAMMRSSSENADKLKELGITVDSSGLLELNEKALKSADISKVEELFSRDNIMSYGSTVMSRLGFASVAAGPVQKQESTVTDADEVTYEGAASLKTDIEKLTSNDLYKKVQGTDSKYGYDVEKLFAAAKSFVGNYNQMLETAGKSYNSGVMSNLARVLEKTSQNKSDLAKFGISVDKQGKLSIDEDAFKKADLSKMQDFFKEYGSSISTNVSLVDYYLTTQANVANGYTATGAYNTQNGFRFDDVF